MKAVIYARYSSDNQREESIEAQIRAIREYCQRNNIQIAKIYTDEARSATTDDRPGFLQMIKDSELGIFDVVIVHKLDRFARNRYDSAFYKRELKKNDVKLISVLENLDDSPESVILESVLEGMAEYYSKNLAREVMKGMKETALQCKHTGGKPPLGYDIGPDKTYVINDREALIVKLIFEMYATGYGYNQIIEKLNSEGYRTKNNNLFGKNSIHDILCNEKYLGIYIFNKSSKKNNGKRNNHKYKNEEEIIKIKGGIPQIIDIKSWEAVKERMDKNKKGSAANKAKEVYLLSGLIYCGKCNGAMVGNRRYAGRNKTKYLSYECSTRKRKKECNMKAINAEYVESIVVDELSRSIFAPEAIERLAQKIHQYAISQSSTVQDDIKALKKELAAIQSQIDNIVDAVAKGLFHHSFKEKMDALELQKETISRQLNEAELQAQINSPTVEMIKAYIAKDSNLNKKSSNKLKGIIQTYVKKVTVYDDYIDIEFIVDLHGGGGAYQFKSTISLINYRHCDRK